MRRLISAALVLVVLALAAAGGALLARRRFQLPGPLPEARAVVVPRGGIALAAAALAAEGVIARPVELRAAALLTRDQGPLHAGELEFPAHASLRQVLHVLRAAKPVQHKITIPDGLTAAQVALLLEQGDALTGDPVLPAEGSVLPQTYLYDRDTTRATLAARAEAAMKRALAAAWASRDTNLPLASPEEALTLASLVQQETARPEERPHVAAVFHNRLRAGMKLQSDPTVIYAVTGGLGSLDRPLTRADLGFDSPYNTYKYAGLPPGPIAMPDLTALQAALHPVGSTDLYFGANGTGGHAFARTEGEHRQNVQRWREIEREREPAR